MDHFSGKASASKLSDDDIQYLEDLMTAGEIEDILRHPDYLMQSRGRLLEDLRRHVQTMARRILFEEVINSMTENQQN